MLFVHLQLTLLDAPENSQNEFAFKLFQRLNVRTFSSLLQLLQAEYKHQSTESSVGNAGIVTPVIRRSLPSLRHYQSWLLSRAALLSAHLGDTTMEIAINVFWSTYVETLGLMLSTSQLAGLPCLDYLLEEDEEIIGFRHLQEGELHKKYFIPNTASRKPKCHDKGVKRHHPNTEMLCRVRDFIEDAIELARSEVGLFEYEKPRERLTLYLVCSYSFRSRYWLLYPSGKIR